MLKSSLLRKFICLLAGALLTFLFAWLDMKSRMRKEAEILTHLGRQVSAQIETLALIGSQLGKPQPFNWAAQQINQGIDPRVISVNIRNSELVLGFSPQEKIDSHSKEGVFIFEKAVRPEQPIDIQVQLVSLFSGFLGARSRFLSDFYILLTFCITAFLFSAFISRFVRVGRIEEIPNTINPITATELNPAGNAAPQKEKKDFSYFYSKISEEIKLANNAWRIYLQSRIDLTNRLYRTQKEAVSLKSKAHECLTEVHKTRKSMDKVSQLAESTRITLENESIRPEIRQQMLMWINALVSTQKTIRSIEVKLEPITLEADLTLQGLLDLCALQEDLSKKLKISGEAMILHAKTIDQYKEEVA